MTQLIKNPFHSPKESQRLSGSAALKAAEQINTLLDEGTRVFDVPIGLVGPIANLLQDAGKDEGESAEALWTVQIVPHATNPNQLATLIVRGPHDWRFEPGNPPPPVPPIVAPPHLP